MDPVSGGKSISTLIFCFKWSAAHTVNAYISHFGLFHSLFPPSSPFFLEIAHFAATIILPAALRSFSKTLRFCANEEKMTLDLVRTFKGAG